MHLNLTESCAEAGIYATSEAERAYWLSREKSYLTASVEIDVHAFHDALGLMYPMNWRSSQNGECETFMLAEMVCGNVTEIYARIGIRYRYAGRLSPADAGVFCCETLSVGNPTR
ncbi:hypothetical protein ACR9HY_22305 [Enterobacter roggenkampii]